MYRRIQLVSLLLAFTGIAGPAWAGTEPVTLANFVRAETDTMIRLNMKAGLASFGKFTHRRQPTRVDQQVVIRPNLDTLYSGLVLDLSSPVTITIPDAGSRYMSMHVINQDHHMFVETGPGDYELTEENVGTRFGVIIVRTFVDPNDPSDIAAANAAQDGLSVSGGGRGPFEAPDWNQQDLAKARSALNELATLGFDATYAFGRAEEVRPVDYLVGAGAGWGGLPNYAAEYVLASVDKNDGETHYAVTAKDVPVEAFWSVTVYNRDGFLEANDPGVQSYNNVTAKPNEDGSHTIHFGGCDDGRINCIPIMSGWNYAVRLYQPGDSIMDGSWTFPEPEPL